MNKRNWMLAGGAVFVAAFAYAAVSHGLIRLPCHSGGTACCEIPVSASLPDPAQTAVPKIVNPGRVSFYDVPLTCPAAPQIGCGSTSKPLLLELEHGGAVSEAWLNRAGTILAVIWPDQSKPGQRSQSVESAFKARQLSAKELTGDARETALKDFQSSAGWYRGADVDRLSEEEAGIIAARLTARIREKITVTDEQTRALQTEFTSALKQKLTGQFTPDELREAMFKICRERLGEKDAAVLQEAFKKGELRPRPNEK
jgi:hypothetical protein